MARALGVELALARAVGALSRLRGGGATSLPGKVLMKLDPGALGALGARLPRGSALVSATNGKTTTTAMAASILSDAGIALVHNRAGANMAGGVATELLYAARRGGSIEGELGLFEVDELWLDEIAAELRPRMVLLGNLFRDQLDRYGELDRIAERWDRALHDGPAREADVVLNADDPLIADLGRDRGGVLYYGVQDDSLALASMAHAADARHCRRCGAAYTFDVVYLGHLGHYRCQSCGQTRPAPQVLATDVRLEGVRACSFTLHTAAGQAPVALALPGLYNVYNALAAAALTSSLGVSLQSIVAGLQSARPAFGRAESVMLAPSASTPAASAPRELQILLVKNPAGANEVLRTLALEPGEHDLLGVLNDQIADGRDVSWIWDADFELLAGRVRRATCSGARAPELALRLKYAGIDPSRIAVEGDLRAALDLAAADRPASDGCERGGAAVCAADLHRDALAARAARGARRGGRRAVMSAAPSPPSRALRVCALYPDLMNIYADRGNLLVLSRRCAWRGIDFQLSSSGLGEALDPVSHDLFYLGGGQDRDQRLCAQDLLDSKRDALHAAAGRGAVVLGVCGGYQLLGHAYTLDDEEIEGVGLLDVRTVREPGARLIGNVAIEVALPERAHDERPSQPEVLAGFENHGGRTQLGSGARALGRVLAGHGNDGLSGQEGAIAGSVIGTYLHGPLLPKNTWFADWLIARALGLAARDLAPLADELEHEAHLSARRAAGV